MPRAEDSEDANRRRIASIVRQLYRIDLICSGTPTERTKDLWQAELPLCHRPRGSPRSLP
jgi:hypothetical protein